MKRVISDKTGFIYLRYIRNDVWLSDWLYWNEIPDIFLGVVVYGNFFMSRNKNIKSLKNSPKSIRGDFIASNCSLKTLEHGPTMISGDYFCNLNDLINLNGAPKSALRSFICSSNQLSTLEGGPEYVGNYFDCSLNQLTSLKGAPKYVVGDFICSYNQLTSLEGIPLSVGGNFVYISTTTKYSEEEIRSLCDVKGRVITQSMTPSEFASLSGVVTFTL